MTPLDAIATRLASQGAGVKGVTIYTGSDVDFPNMSTTGPAILSVARSSGSRRTRVQNQKNGSLHNQHFQIVSRHPRYPNAEALIDLAYDVIELENTLVADVFFLWIVPMQDPFELGKDANGNPRLAFNVETCWRR